MINKICPCCESDNIYTKYKEMYDKDTFIEGDFSLLGCNNCKFEWIIPQLNEKQLNNFYPKDYYSFNKKSNLAQIYHKLSAKYHSSNRLMRFLLQPFRPLWYSYFVNNSFKDKYLLEIGCGAGSTLEIYRLYGIKTKGLEPYGNI